MKKLNITYIGVGTNLGNKMNNIQLAYKLIQAHIGNISRRSNIYESPPWGFESTNEFYNSVIEVRTYLTPNDLLNELQKIEIIIGKKQNYSIGYSSRLIDLDIIDYSQQILDSDHLNIPHSHLAQRSFVLFPLFDINPTWINPRTQKPISELIQIIEKDIRLIKIENHTDKKA